VRWREDLIFWRSWRDEWAQGTVAGRDFVAEFRERARTRAGSWLMGCYRFCWGILVALCIGSIGYAVEGTFTRRRAIESLIDLAVLSPVIGILLAAGRRRDEIYYSGDRVSTRAVTYASGGTVLVLCLGGWSTLIR